MWIIRLLVSLVTFGFVYPNVLTETLPPERTQFQVEQASDDDGDRRGKA